MKKTITLLLVICMLLTAVCGCSGAKDANAATEDKDTLVVYSSGAFQGTWDPAANAILSNKHLEWNVFDRCLQQDAEGNFIPGLCTEWEYLEDGYTLRLKVREGVTFHDGSALTAEDIAASIEYTTRPESVRSMDYTVQVLCKVIDDYTLEVTPSHNQPLGLMLNELAFDAILSADDIANGTLDTVMNGCGPYKMLKYENETVYLEAFENYWDTENAAKIKNVEYKYVAESATRLSALQAGEADLIERLELEQIDVVKGDPNCVCEEVWADEQRMLVFKTTQAPMDNQKLRQAISYAIDTETIVNDIMNQKARVADSYTSAVSNIYAPAADIPTYDPERAKALLAEAGYPNGEGLPNLYYLTSIGLYPKSKEIAEFIVSNLNAIGINVDLVVEETATWEAHLYQEDSCHMIDTGWMLCSGEGNESLGEIFLSPSILSFSNLPDVDEALRVETATLDPEERVAYIRDVLNPLLAEKCVTFPMYDTIMAYGYSNQLENVEIKPSSNISFWKISFK